MGLASVIIKLLVSVFKSFPTIERLVALAIKQHEKDCIAEAINRKQAKDEMVDRAIDNRVGNDCEND